MNFIDATIKRNGGAPAAVAGNGAVLPLPPNVGGREGQRVVYGVRPEHLELRDGEASAPIGHNSSAVPAEVVVVEPTGAEILVVAKMAGKDIQAVFKERHAFRPGDNLNLTPKLDAVHIFDKDTGRRIDA
jgi:multiple sugar transport system ATP-binding protein